MCVCVLACVRVHVCVHVCVTGVSKKAFAFDLTAACSGFLFATVTAAQFLNNGGHKNALIVRLV